MLRPPTALAALADVAVHRHDRTRAGDHAGGVVVLPPREVASSGKPVVEIRP